jgi:exodeoxyribonuclease VII large subunit
LTGIGHERDSTVLDEVAHTRFDTPSKVILGIENVIRQRAKQAKELFQAVTTTAQQVTQRCRLTSEGSHTQVKEAARQQLATAHRKIETDLGAVRVGALKAVRQAADESRKEFSAIETEARQQVADARQALPGIVEAIKGNARASLREARSGSALALRATVERSAVMAANVRAQAERAMSDIAINARRTVHDASANTEALVREIAGQGPDKTLGRGFAMVVSVWRTHLDIPPTGRNQAGVGAQRCGNNSPI